MRLGVAVIAVRYILWPDADWDKGFIVSVTATMVWFLFVVVIALVEIVWKEYRRRRNGY